MDNSYYVLKMIKKRSKATLQTLEFIAFQMFRENKMRSLFLWYLLLAGELVCILNFLRRDSLVITGTWILRLVISNLDRNTGNVELHGRL